MPGGPGRGLEVPDVAELLGLPKDHYVPTGAALAGTFSTAVGPKGDKAYVTWNVNCGGRSWDCCALTVIHVPASERP